MHSECTLAKQAPFCPRDRANLQGLKIIVDKTQHSRTQNSTFFFGTFQQNRYADNGKYRLLIICDVTVVTDFIGF